MLYEEVLLYTAVTRAAQPAVYAPRVDVQGAHDMRPLYVAHLQRPDMFPQDGT